MIQRRADNRVAKEVLEVLEVLVLGVEFHLGKAR